VPPPTSAMVGLGICRNLKSSGGGVGWWDGDEVSKLHNERVLFHQCSMFYTAWKRCLSAEDCVYISGSVSGGFGLRPHWGSVPIPRWGGAKSLDLLCPPCL